MDDDVCGFIVHDATLLLFSLRAFAEKERLQGLSSRFCSACDEVKKERNLARRRRREEREEEREREREREKRRETRKRREKRRRERRREESESEE